MPKNNINNIKLNIRGGQGTVTHIGNTASLNLKIPTSSSGTSSIKTAIISQTLDRGGDEIEGSSELTPEVSNYKIKLTTLTAVNIGTTVTKGSSYTYTDEDYTATKDFVVESEAQLPPSASYWEEYTGNDAWILHQRENLIHCSPWLQVGDTVAVQQLRRDDDETAKYYIIETARKVEDIEGVGSIYWDQNLQREKAVFA